MKKWKRSLLALAALALFLVLFGSAAYSGTARPYNRSGMLNNEDRIARYAAGGWQVHWGPAGGAGAAWSAFTPDDYPAMASYRGTVWLRTELPSLAEWRDPYLFLHNIKNVEVFIDTPDNPVYRYRPAGFQARYTSFMKLHPIRLQQDDAGKTLYLRMDWDRQPVTANWLMIGTRMGVVFDWLDYEWRWYAFGVLSLALGMISLCLYAWRLQDNLCGWFALLCLSSGIGFLLLSVSLQWFLPLAESLYYWRELLLPVALLAVLGFYDEALQRAYCKRYGWMKAAALLFAAIAAITALFDAPLYGQIMTRWFPLFFIAVFGAMSYSLIRHAFRSLTRVTLWLTLAYCVLMAAALLHLAFNATPQTQSWLHRISPALAELSTLILPVGLMAFIACLAALLFIRYAAEHDRLQAYAVDLSRRYEALEKTATTELSGKERSEQPHRTAAEPDAALYGVADLSAPHTAVVPGPPYDRPVRPDGGAISDGLPRAALWATPRTAVPEAAVAEEGDIDVKADGGSGVIRALKIGRQPFKLSDALRHLIDKTAAESGVRIDADIDAPRLDAADGILQRLILDALREGLTNGLKHGACSHFRFRLSAAHERLSLRLFNDGAPYDEDKPGLGLSAMIERVRLLG
ncbi:sensor histidine kinase, partial [Paenibacillus darwinianus]